MAVSEPRRLALHQAARDVLGEEEGDTLMALSPPANTDIATMQALEVLRSGLGAEIERATNRMLRWSIGSMVVLQGSTVGLLSLILG